MIHSKKTILIVICSLFMIGIVYLAFNVESKNERQTIQNNLSGENLTNQANEKIPLEELSTTEKVQDSNKNQNKEEPSDFETRDQETNDYETKTSADDVSTVIDRVISASFENDQIYQFGGKYPDAGEDYLVALAQSDDAVFQVYGCVSKEYGCRGILINYRLDGSDNYNTFDYEWNAYFEQPKLALADYDNDGREELAFSFLWAEGTGVYIEKLVLFETFETAHIEAYEFTEKRQSEELANAIVLKVNEDAKTVTMKRADTKETILQNISYNVTENGRTHFEGISYGNQVRFDVGKEIVMYVDIGIMTDVNVEPFYAEQSLAMKVKYCDFISSDKEKFSIEQIVAGNR